MPSPFTETLVSVIIPAHNATATLERTLHSARSQTHQKLEIIVVDDASSDGTAALAAAHASHDPRVKLISNPVCRGVGGARNAGARESTGSVLCFIDADDLMVPDAIAARLERMNETGAAMCYCWSAIIDGQDRITSTRYRPNLSGDIFPRLALGNFLGNGSCILVLKSAYEETGGYNERMFQLGAQGCEDYQFYLDVARRHPVACVERFLIGYRELPGNMSSNTSTMMRSLKMVHEGLVRDFPELATQLHQSQIDLQLHFAVRNLRNGKWLEGARLLARIWPSLPYRTALALRRTLGLLRTAKADLKINDPFPFARADAPAGSRGELLTLPSGQQRDGTSIALLA